MKSSRILGGRQLQYISTSTTLADGMGTSGDVCSMVGELQNVGDCTIARGPARRQRGGR